MAPPTNALDLTWLNAVKQKAEVGVNSTTGTISPSVDDNEIQAAITAFSQWLLKYTGQPSLNAVASASEVYDGNGNNQLFLRGWPILNLTALTINGVAIPASTGFNSWGAFVEQSGKSIALRNGPTGVISFPYPWAPTGVGAPGRRGPNFAYGKGNITVEYTAGYPPTPVVNEVDTIAAQTIALQQGPWASDGGVVFYPSLVPLTPVANSPAAGEYAVSNGLYVFNVADNAAQVAVTYDINRAPFDLEYAVRCAVAINYKRKGWQDQASKTVNTREAVSTVRYRDWDFAPREAAVFQSYQRKAIYA